MCRQWVCLTRFKHTWTIWNENIFGIYFIFFINAIKKEIKQTNANARNFRAYLGGGGNLLQAFLFLTVQVAVGRHLFVLNTPPIGAHSLIVWRAEVGSFSRCRLTWLLGRCESHQVVGWWIGWSLSLGHDIPSLVRMRRKIEHSEFVLVVAEASRLSLGFASHSTSPLVHHHRHPVMCSLLKLGSLHHAPCHPSCACSYRTSMPSHSVLING